MNKERLLMIVKHLKEGKLGHETFDFSVVNGKLNADGVVVRVSAETSSNACGTNGCAFGEFPFIFPSQWEFKTSKDGYVLPWLVGSTVAYAIGIWKQLDAYLDLKAREADMLFLPYSGYSSKMYPGMEKLGEDATKEEVADNILAFIKYKESINNKQNEQVSE